jgi:hypothetical protein
MAGLAARVQEGSDPNQREHEGNDWECGDGHGQGDCSFPEARTFDAVPFFIRQHELEACDSESFAKQHRVMGLEIDRILVRRLPLPTYASIVIVEHSYRGVKLLIS